MSEITLRKMGSPHRVVFAVDKEDPFFTNIEVIKLKTGAVAANHYILTSDVPVWRSMYSNEGFIQVADEVQAAPQKAGLTISKSAKVKKNCTTIVQNKR